MYQLGHYGVALLLYAPLGATVALGGNELAAIVGAVLCLGLSTLPDIDHKVPLIEHRGPTHTVLFAVFVGAALAGVASVLEAGPPPFGESGFVTFAFLCGVLSIGSHLLADALTPMGIRPFWPLWNRQFSLKVTRAANPIANYALFVLGLGATLVAATVADVI